MSESEAETHNRGEAEMEKVCNTLQAIAASFASDSDEARAIRDAALAYTIVSNHERLQKSYEKLRRAFGGNLTENMKADLRRHGIDPDELEAEQSV